MIATIIFVSLIFIGIGLGVNRRNAKAVLTSYNTGRRGEENPHTLTRDAMRFRYFHVIMGITTLTVGLALRFLVDETASLLFLILFPVAAYLFYFLRFIRSAPGQPSWLNPLVVMILIGSTLFILVLFRAGYTENELRYEKDQWTIGGMYGETIRPGDITYIQLVDTLPKFRLKLNGFATGRIRKGIFQTQDRQRVKLLIDTPDGPYVRVHRASGDDLYLALRSRPSPVIVEEIRLHYPIIAIR